MNRTVLLANAAALALTAGGHLASAKAPNLHRLHRLPTEVLYNQNNPDLSYFIESDNFTSGVYTSLDSAGADDFVVPAGHKWTITEVDVSGAYFNNGGGCTSACATSEVVTFYKIARTEPHPGRIAGRGADTFTLNCIDNSGNFACSIPNGVTLAGGRRHGRVYWVSVVANMNTEGAGNTWEWYLTDTDSNNTGKWQNPRGGFHECTTWTSISICYGYPHDDLAFELIGTQQ